MKAGELTGNLMKRKQDCGGVMWFIQRCAHSAVYVGGKGYKRATFPVDRMLKRMFIELLITWTGLDN